MHQNVQQHRREKKTHKSGARLKQNVKIVSKNVQILQASISFTYIAFCAKGVYINVHFVMMKSLLEITIKNVNIILNNVGGGNV